VSRRRIIQTLGAGGAIGIAGCLGEDDPDDPDDADDADDSEVDADDTDDDDGMEDPDDIPETEELVVAIPEDISSFDSIEITDGQTRSVTGLIYERLFAVDFDTEVQPYLATGSERPDDETVVVELREGVEFHNGDPFDANSVQASIERSIGTARDGFIDPWYDGSEIIDDHTIEFNLVEPFAPLEAEMFPEIQMVPAAAHDGDLDLGDEPIGTGPYVFDEYQDGELFRVTRNDNYWFEGSDDMPSTPPIETITFRIVGESSTQESALETGEVDAIVNPSSEGVERLSEEDGIEVHDIVGGTFQDVHFPVHASPWSNRNVRKGVSRLVPREDILDVVWNGRGAEAYLLVPPMFEDVNTDEFRQEMMDEYVGHDQERGVELIEQGFEEEGISPPHETTFLVNDDDARVRATEIIVNTLEGTELFDIDINELDWSAYSDRTGDGEAHERDEIIMGGITGSPTPWEYFNRIVTESGFYPACCNFGQYSDERIEELLQETSRTTDEDELVDMYQEMTEIVADDSPRALYAWMPEINITRDHVRGWQTFYDPAWQFSCIFAPYADAVTYIEE